MKRPGQRKPLRRRKPLHSPWVQNQKVEKLTGKSYHLSWELGETGWCNVSLVPYKNHWVGEPALQISGTLEKEEATLPSSTFKSFQLTLSFLHLSQTVCIIYYLYFVEVQYSKHGLVFNNSVCKGNQELGAEIRYVKPLIPAWCNNIILQCLTGHIFRDLSFEHFKRNGSRSLKLPFWSIA